MSGTIRRDRAQTELFAALVAVVVVCVAVSAYAGFLDETVSDLGVERSLGESTADRVWEAISQQGYFNSSETVGEHIDSETLPQGRSVAITVSYVGEDGRLESAGNRTYGPSGQQSDLSVPEAAERYERPIPIRFGPGDIQPGKLTVVVWS